VSTGARLRPAILALGLAGLALGAQDAAAGGWRPFEGTWSAAGQRQYLRLGPRELATIHLSGAFAITRGEGFRKGFRAEAIAFDDGVGGGLGAMVLTDDKGDQVFCDLKGATSVAGRLIVATITGGSGAYAGVEGDFSFQWRHLTKGGETEFQVLAADIKGRTRRSAQAAPEKPR
jgi:hypothetical protein